MPVNYNTVSPFARRFFTFPSAGIPHRFFRVTSYPPDLPARESERKSLGFTDFLTNSKGETFYPEKANANC